MSLTMHCGAREASREEITRIDVPPVRYNEKGHITYQPIAHTTLLNHVEREMSASGMEIVNERHFLNRDGGHYFAQLELAGVHSDYCSFVGVRNSHLGDMAAGMAMGTRVFICDNLCFSGDVVINRKHSRFIQRDLPQLIAGGVATLGYARATQEERVEHYKYSPLLQSDAEHAFIRLLELGAIGRSPRTAWDQWRDPKEQRWGSNPTAWKFMNVITNGWTSAPTSSLLVNRSKLLNSVLDQVTEFEPEPPPTPDVVDAEFTVLAEVA